MIGDVIEIMQSILTGEPEFGSIIRDGVTDEMLSVLKKMLAKDQSGRPSAEELKKFFKINLNI